MVVRLVRVIGFSPGHSECTHNQASDGRFVYRQKPDFMQVFFLMPKQPVQIPDRFRAKPLIDDPQVSTDLSVSRTYEPAQINALQNLGMIKVDGDRFKSLSDLGEAAKSIGLVKLIHGGYIVSADNLLQAIGFCGQIVSGEPNSDGKTPSNKERMEAAKLSGYLAGQLAKVNGTVTKVEQARAEVAIQVDKQRRQSFQPGMTITVQEKAPVNP